MRVLHLSVSDCLDSSSRAALHLHRKLRGLGADSQMLVKNRHRQNEGVQQAAAGEHEDAGLFSIVQNHCFDSNERSAMSSVFQIGYPGGRVAEHPAVRACDVIHLHQIAGFLPLSAIRELLALNKPLVWSLPDAWPFTGGCFHPAGCVEFRDACAACPQLRDDGFHLPQALLEDKHALLAGGENMTVLAPGEWLAKAAGESKLLRATRIEKIAPSFFEARSEPVSETNSESLRFTFLCETPDSESRAARTLQTLLNTAQTYGSFRSLVRKGNLSLAVGGLSNHGQPDFGLPLRFSESAEPLFAGSDLLIMPRADENRATAVLEARAHRLPILAFDAGGMSEFITHKLNGWLVNRMEPRTLAEAMCYLATNPALVRELGQALPPETRDHAAEVLRLYEDLIATNSVAHFSNPAPVGAARPELLSLCENVVRSVAQHSLKEHSADDLRLRLEALERTLQGAETLLSEAQRNLATIERRQQQVLESAGLPARTISKLRQAQKSTVSLRNKLKWRARRLKVFAPSAQVSGPHMLPTHREAAPEPPFWVRTAHALFLKNHWMKHGKKDQYPPRPLRPEKFPAPGIRDENLPRIAVVTPSFMQGNYLEETIRSVVDQGYPNLAYAVNDGGSTDNTIEVIRRHADRITIWTSKPDSGQARAVVSGFEKISGEVMAWLNSDDLFVHGALRFIGEFFATHPAVDVIYGHRIIINERSEEIARWVVPPHNPRITPYVDPVPQETLFWRASMWERVGGVDPSFRFALDWDLVMRFQKAGANIVRVPYFLGCFRVHSQQKLSARAESIGAEEIACVRERETGHVVNFEELQPYKRWMEVHGAIYSRLLEMGIRL